MYLNSNHDNVLLSFNGICISVLYNTVLQKKKKKKRNDNIQASLTFPVTIKKCSTMWKKAVTICICFNHLMVNKTQ